MLVPQKSWNKPNHKCQHLRRSTVKKPNHKKRNSQHMMFPVTSTLTAHLTPNTYLGTPRLRYCIPKINTMSAEQLHRAMLPLLLPYKKPCHHWPTEYVATHSPKTGYLRPLELDTSKKPTEVPVRELDRERSYIHTFSERYLQVVPIEGGRIGTRVIVVVSPELHVRVVAQPPAVPRGVSPAGHGVRERVA